MKRITIGRYTNDSIGDVVNPPDLHKILRDDGDYDITKHYSGWIEGESDNGQNWILWMDGHGTPLLYWPDRDPDGGVRGKPISLDHLPGKSYGTSDHPMDYWGWAEEKKNAPKVTGEAGLQPEE